MKQVPFIAGIIADEQCALIKHFAEGGTVKRMPVKLRHVPGLAWEVMDFNDNFNFDYYEYRAVKEEPEPATEKVVLEAWFTGSYIVWYVKDYPLHPSLKWRRVPSEDKVVEVENNGN